MTPERPAGAAAQPKSSRPPKSRRTPSGPEPKRQTSPDGAGLYAALDLGTNSCRMLIARPKGPQFEVIDSFSRAVELGTGLEATGRLGYGPMARTVQALRICRRKLDDHNVVQMRLVATEACRRARNSSEFIRKIQRETGLRLEIIPAEEEARLAVISCAPLVVEETDRVTCEALETARLEAERQSLYLTVSVNPVAPDEAAYPRKLERKTGWKAKVEHHAAGALKYAEYDFFKRWVMRRISEKEGRPLDTSRDYEFTDWAALNAFVDSFVCGLRAGN